MSDILVKIDGKDVAASEGMTVLGAAQSAGISIPPYATTKNWNPSGLAAFAL